MQKHMMIVESQADGETQFVCHEMDCGRRLAFDFAGSLTVLEHGNPKATHLGSSGQLSFELSI